MKPSDKTSLARHVRRVSVRIPKKKAEYALRFLSLSETLDHGASLETRDDDLVVPLIRDLNLSEREELARLAGKLVFGEEEFAIRPRPPRSLEDALSGRIPSELLVDLPKSFDIVGDIAILDLNPELTSHEGTVGQAIMMAHTNVRAVFAKAGPVSGPDRVRPLRRVAGENRTETIHREFGCLFKVDLSKVFFSPRLSTEHQRVAESVRQAEVVVDMFAGVGPFSILIAKRLGTVEVNAIDSNAGATRLIEENARLNHVESKVHVWPGNASEIVPGHIEGKATRVIMNHPSEAKDFIETACRALRTIGGVIHYYTFSDGEDCELKGRDEFEAGLKASGWNAEGTVETRKVREVGPFKWQVAVDARVVPTWPKLRSQQ